MDMFQVQIGAADSSLTTSFDGVLRQHGLHHSCHAQVAPTLDWTHT